MNWTKRTTHRPPFAEEMRSMGLGVCERCGDGSSDVAECEQPYDKGHGTVDAGNLCGECQQAVGAWPKEVA